MKKKLALIIGGSGLIGTEVVKLLIKKNIAVVNLEKKKIISIEISKLLKSIKNLILQKQDLKKR